MAVSIAHNLTVNLDFFAPVRSTQGGVIAGVPVSIGLHKDSSVTPDWNKIAGMYRDCGVYERFKLDALKKLKLEGLRGSKEVEHVYKKLMEMMMNEGISVEPMKVRNFLTIFIVFLIGMVASLGVFLKELGLSGIRKIFRGWSSFRATVVVLN